MAFERVIAVKFISEGAEKLQRDFLKVAGAMKKTGKGMLKSGQQASEWVDRNKKAMLAMAAAGTTLMYGIIKASPLLNASLAQTRLAFSLIAMQIGNNVAPMFELINKAAWALLKAWDSLSPGTQKVISWIIVIGATLLILAGIIGGVLIFVAAISAAITSLGITLAAIATAGLVVLLIGLFIALGVVLYKLEQQTGWFTDAWDFLWGKLKSIGKWVADVAVKVWDGFLAHLTRVWETIKAVIATAILFIYYLFTGQFDKILELGAKFLFRFLAIWGDTFIKIGETVKEGISKVVGFFVEFGPKIWEQVKKIGTKAFWATLITDLVSIGKNIFGAIIGGIVTGATAIKDAFVSVFKKAIGFMVRWSKGEVGMSPTLIEMGINIVTSIITGLSSKATEMLTAGKDMLKNFVQGILDYADTAVDKAKSVADKVTGFFDFDNPSNDAWAMKSGMDMIKHFQRGVASAGAISVAGETGGSMLASALPSGGGGGNSTTNITIGNVTLNGDAFSLGAGKQIGNDISKTISSALGRR